ncbi:MAG: PilZ domain-containing protein [Sulfuricaulis sp.]
MIEKRRYVRYLDSISLDVATPGDDIRTYMTRDVSDGGIFVLAKYHDQLAIGAEVTITPTQHAHETEQPIKRGRVVRRSGQGMGIEFLDPGIMTVTELHPLET